MAIENGIRKVERSEMELKLTEEDKLVAMMASKLYCYGILQPDAIKKAYSILDEVIKVREERLMAAMEKESRRRSGGY